LQGPDEPDRLVAAFRLTDDLDIMFRKQQAPHALARQTFIIDDQNFHGTVSVSYQHVDTDEARAGRISAPDRRTSTAFRNRATGRTHTGFGLPTCLHQVTRTESAAELLHAALR
jgi:hypothetical protein